MIGFTIFALWFLAVSVWLLRQWWVSELALVPSGVAEADSPATLPVSVASLGRGGDAQVPAGRGRAVPALLPEPVLPTPLRSLHVAGHSAR